MVYRCFRADPAAVHQLLPTQSHTTIQPKTPSRRLVLSVNHPRSRAIWLQELSMNPPRPGPSWTQRCWNKLSSSVECNGRKVAETLDAESVRTPGPLGLPTSSDSDPQHPERCRVPRLARPGYLPLTRETFPR